MNDNILEIISDMERFTSENWEHFQKYMQDCGFSESEVDEMGIKLETFLEEEGLR